MQIYLVLFVEGHYFLDILRTLRKYYDRYAKIEQKSV